MDSACSPRLPSATPNSTRLPGFSAASPDGQRRLVDEDVAAVVAGEEAEALVGVVPLDLAGGHGEALQKMMRMEVGEVEPAILPVAATSRRHEYRDQANCRGRRQPRSADNVMWQRVGLQTTRPMPDTNDYER